MTEILFRSEDATLLLPVEASAHLVLWGRFADGGIVRLPPGYAQWSSSDAAVAVVDATGSVWARSAGTAVITVSKNNTLHAAAAVQVGVWEAPAAYDIFPDSYVLEAGGTRQIVFGAVGAEGALDLGSATAGTFYISSNESVFSVTVNGLVTAVGSAGQKATITVINAGIRAELSFSIAAVAANGSAVDSQGGIVKNSDNISLSLPPDTLTGQIVTVTTVAQESLGYVVPGGFAFVQGFSLDFGGADLANPAALTVPASGYSDGASLFLFRQGSFITAPGTYVQSWELVDKATVTGEVAHTTSPPYPGGITEGTYFLGGNENLAVLEVQYMYPDMVIEVISGTQPYFVRPSSVFANRLPLPLDATNVRLWRVAPDGKATFKNAPLSGLTKGQVIPLTLEVAEPTIYDKRPSIQSAVLSIEGGKPTVTITAYDFHTKDANLLHVVFYSQNRINLEYTVKVDSIENNIIRVDVPTALPLGHISLRVENLVERYEFKPGADPVKVFEWISAFPLTPDYEVPHLVWVANVHSNTVSVIDPQAENGPKSILEIEVGQGPSDVVVSPDGLRVFVSNSGDGTVSVIDALTLKVIDTDPIALGVNHVKINEGHSQPWFMALDPDTGILYISERAGAYVYTMTTKGDAFYYTGSMKVGGAERLTGLTGIAVTEADLKTGKRYLAVATPGVDDHWYGGDFGFDPRNPGYLYYGLLEDGRVKTFQRIEAGFKPFGVTAGKSPYEVAVAVRGSDAVGMVVFNLREGKQSHNLAMDMERAIEIRRAFARTKETLGTTITGTILNVMFPGFNTSIEMTIASTWTAKAYFDINNIESLVFTKDYKYAFVVGNCTFNGDTDFTRDPSKGMDHGGNIGIIRDPLDSAKAKLIGVTKEMPMAWPDEITIDPYNIYLLATCKGTNKVLYYDIGDLINAAETMQKAYAAEGKKIDKTVDAYVEKAGNPNLKLDKGEIEYLIGARPSGIASSPEAPTDFIANSVIFLEEGKIKIPVVRLTYTVTGLNPDRPLTIKLWKSNSISLDSSSTIKEELKAWILRDQYITPGRHTVELPLIAGLPAREQTWYIVQLDAEDYFTEHNEGNNTANFQIRVAALTAKYDVDPLDFEFGRYIRGVKLLNEFELRFKKELATSGTTVQVWLGYTELKLDKLKDNLYRFTLDMGNVPDGTELKFEVKNGDVTAVQGSYLIHTFAMPDWINPEKHPDKAAEIRTIEWNDRLNAYWVQAVNFIHTWKEKIPEAAYILGGKSISLNYGTHLTLAFNLEGKPIFQDAGPTLWLDMFGFNVMHANIPAQVLLNAIGATEYEIKVSSIQEFLDKVRESAGSNQALGNVLNYLASPQNKDYPISKPGVSLEKKGDKEELKAEDSYSIKLTSKPFIVDNNLNLLVGEISITSTYQKSIPAFKWSYNVPPLGSVVQFEVGVEIGLQLKTESTTGMKVDNGDLKTVSKELKLSATGVLAASGKAKFAFGVAGITATLETNLGIALTWTETLSLPTITFPFSLVFKAQTYELWEFFTQEVYSKEILKSDNIFKSIVIMPPDIPTRSGQSIDDEAIGNNSLADADNLGVLTGSSAMPGLSLRDRYDRDYYRFQIIDAATSADNVKLIFPDATIANPNVSAQLLNESGIAVSEMIYQPDHTGILSLENLPAGSYILSVWGDEALPVNYNLAIAAPESSQAALVADMTVKGSPASIEPGKVIDLTVKVLNAGGAASPAAEAALLWSRDRLLDPGDALLLPSFFVPALQPGEVWQQTFSLALPASAIGPVTLGFVADRRQYVAEACRVDNTATYALEVALAPDAFEDNNTIYTATFLGGIVAGRQIAGLNLASLMDTDIFSFELAETGTTYDALSVSRSEGEGAIGLLLLDESGSFLMEGTADGAAGTNRLSLADLPAGRYFLAVLPDGEAGIFYTLAIESAVRTKANLAVADLVAGAGYELLPGEQTRTARVTVSNYGGTAARSFTVSVLMTHNGTTSTIGAPVVVGVLGAGQTMDVEVPIAIPSELAAGMVTVTARVDAAGSVDELNEADNEYSASVLLAGSPDADEAAEDATGGFIDLGVLRGTKVYNRNLHSLYDQDLVLLGLSGTGGAGDEIRLTFDETPGMVGIALYDSRMNFVAAGVKAATGDYRISLNGRPGGAYYLLVRDGGAERSGSESQAYALTVTAPDAAGANLTPSGLSLDSALVADGSASVTATVQNIGDTASAAFTGAYYLSTDKIIDANDVLLATANFAALAAAAELTDSRVLDLSGVLPGTYYLGLLVDDGALVAEPVETDNVRLSPLVILPASDAHESNDSLMTASIVSLSGGSASVTGLNLHNGEDVDIFRFTLAQPAGVADIARINYRTQEPFLLFSLLDASGNVIRSVIGSNGNASLSLNGLASGVYFLKVDGAQDFSYSTGYDLSMTVAGAA
ncbi:MAG: Ig-like domain-containing protein [Syntrophobacterales bacterium]|nr:Ig-like domain-containing protein [Syntrophobacterales bacterium]